MKEISLNKFYDCVSLVELNMLWKPEVSNINDEIIDFIETHKKYRSFIYKLMELGSSKKTDNDSIIVEISYDKLSCSMDNFNKDIINEQLKLMEENGVIKKTLNNENKDFLLVEFEEDYVKKYSTIKNSAIEHAKLISIEEIIKTGDIIKEESDGVFPNFSTFVLILVRYLVSSEHTNINLKDCIKLVMEDMGFTLKGSETLQSLFLIELLTKSSILERFTALKITVDINKWADMIVKLRNLRDSLDNYCEENSL